MKCPARPTISKALLINHLQDKPSRIAEFSQRTSQLPPSAGEGGAAARILSTVAWVIFGEDIGHGRARLGRHAGSRAAGRCDVTVERGQNVDGAAVSGVPGSNPGTFCAHTGVRSASGGRSCPDF